jgi:hypothetical protein
MIAIIYRKRKKLSEKKIRGSMNIKIDEKQP